MTVAYTRGRQSDQWLKLSHDRKVSPAGIYQASRRRWIAMVPNSFGLPAGLSCPGKTEFCVSCYANRSENQAGVSDLVHHNYRLLLEAGTEDGMALLLAEMVRRYAIEADRRGLPPEDRIFRIHWDGDFFSLAYTRAWARVIRGNPDIRFWAYSRSLRPPVNVVPILGELDNLALYLSADEWNYHEAQLAVALFPQVRLALCAVDYRTGRGIAVREGSVDTDYAGELDARTPAICPENAGKLALMDEGRGACVTCRICPDGRRDVIFSTSHVEDVRLPTPRVRPSVLGPDASVLTLTCEWCESEFPYVNRQGRVPRFCHRDCQVRAYTHRRKLAHA